MPDRRVPIITPCVDCGAPLKRFRIKGSPRCRPCKVARNTRVSREKYQGSEQQRKQIDAWREAHPECSRIAFCTECRSLIRVAQDGQRPKWCKTCTTERTRQREVTIYRTARNRRAKERFDSDPEYREREMERRHRTWVKTKARMEADPEFRRNIQDRMNRWDREKRATDSEYRDHRRAKHANRHALGEVPVGIRELLIQVQRSRCANPFCRARLQDDGSTHLDHIVAIARGGTNATSNLQLLCAFCNQSKKDKTYGDFLERERLKRELSTA